jgi:hypothetical protein
MYLLLHVLQHAWASDFLPGSPITIPKDLVVFRSIPAGNLNIILKFIGKNKSGEPLRGAAHGDIFYTNPLIPISDESFESIPRALEQSLERLVCLGPILANHKRGLANFRDRFNIAGRQCSRTIHGRGSLARGSRRSAGAEFSSITTRGGGVNPINKASIQHDTRIGARCLRYHYT